MLVWSVIAVAVVAVTDVVLLWPRCQTFTFPDAPPERDCTSYPVLAALVTGVAFVAGAAALRTASEPE
jgi:hypothetical protein